MIPRKLPLFDGFIDYVDKPSTPTVMPEWFIETQSISIDV